ncbi:hypothetical protein NG2371_05213 [Nocardia gamkensis]|nr:hypothetical protein [Nocardia gamkensis]
MPRLGRGPVYPYGSCVPGVMHSAEVDDFMDRLVAQLLRKDQLPESVLRCMRIASVRSNQYTQSGSGISGERHS